MTAPATPGDDTGPRLLGANRSELRQLFELAVPLAAQQLGFQLMGNVDAAMLGHHTQASLAAAGVGNTLLFAISSVGMGLVMGADSVIPRAIGAGRHDDARRSLGAAIRIAFAAGLVLVALVVASPYLLSVIHVDPQVAAEARTYTQLRAIGIIPFLLSIALRSYLAARDVTRPLIVAVVGANLANAALDLVLIFGVPALGIPAMGVAGAAIATVTVQILSVLVYVAAVRSLDTGRPVQRPRRADILEILKFGGPVAGQLLAEIGIFGVATLLAAYLGTIPAAAHSIALNLSSFTFSAAVGIGSATSVRVGQAIGAGNLGLARRRGVIGLELGALTMGACSIAFIAIPATIAGLFTTDVAVIAATIPLLQIASAFQLFDGTQAIAAGALRGIGDTRSTLVGNAIGHYVIGLPISLALAFHFAQGTPGIWWGLSAGLFGTASYLVWRLMAITRSPRAAGPTGREPAPHG